MARAKSAVLSAADKKAVIADIKTKIKTLKDELKVIDGTVKTTSKELSSANTKLEASLALVELHKGTIATLKADIKAKNPVFKDAVKASTAKDKELAKLSKDLEAITAPVAA